MGFRRRHDFPLKSWRIFYWETRSDGVCGVEAQELGFRFEMVTFERLLFLFIFNQILRSFHQRQAETDFHIDDLMSTSNYLVLGPSSILCCEISIQAKAIEFCRTLVLMPLASQWQPITKHTSTTPGNGLNASLGAFRELPRG